MNEKPHCPECASDDVHAISMAKWNHRAQQWGEPEVYEYDCSSCDETFDEPTWVEVDDLTETLTDIAKVPIFMRDQAE